MNNEDYILYSYDYIYNITDDKLNGFTITFTPDCKISKIYGYGEDCCNVYFINREHSYEGNLLRICMEICQHLVNIYDEETGSTKDDFYELLAFLLEQVAESYNNEEKND